MLQNGKKETDEAKNMNENNIELEWTDIHWMEDESSDEKGWGTKDRAKWWNSFDELKHQQLFESGLKYAEEFSFNPFLKRSKADNVFMK